MDQIIFFSLNFLPVFYFGEVYQFFNLEKFTSFLIWRSLPVF